MLELFQAGGVVMWPLLLLSAMMVGIILERFWSLRQATILPPGLGAEVATLVHGRRIDPVHIERLRQHSPLGRVLATVLAERNRPHEVMISRVEDTGRDVVHGLGKWLNTLGTIAIIAPLLGLLGTVSGMIKMFLVINQAGVGNANQLAGGIGEALMATAFGLVVAIPAYIFHRYFRGKVQDLGLALARETAPVIEALDTTFALDRGQARTAA